MDEKVEVIAAGIIFNKEKDKILLIKRPDKLWKDAWSIPGGHVEYREKIEDALRRELKEELDLEIIKAELLCHEEIILEKKHMISFDFLVIAEDKFKANHEIEEAKWILLKDIKNIEVKLKQEILAKALNKVK